MATQLSARLDERYREQVQALRTAVGSRVGEVWGSSVSPDDLDASFARFAQSAATLVRAGQARGVALAGGYLRTLVTLEAGRVPEFAPSLDDIVGITEEGASLLEGMDAMPSLVKQQIGKGEPVSKAMQFGRYLAERFADAQVTSAVDRYTDHATRTSGQFTGWRGVIHGTCGPCRSRNSGEHSLDTPMYRHPHCKCSKEFIVEGGKQIQQALPGFDGPEFEVPVKRGYIDPQLRPNADPELAGMWDRLVDIHKQLVDRFNLDSEWNGQVKRIAEGTAVAEWDGSISINVARLVNEPHIREHNLIHEVFHTISRPSEGAFQRYAGWEEGLVDHMTILSRDSVWQDIGVKLTAKQTRQLAASDAESSYGLYRYAWENMRSSTGLSADDFYGQMIRTPLENRPALAKKLGVSDFDLGRALQILGGAD